MKKLQRLLVLSYTENGTSMAHGPSSAKFNLSLPFCANETYTHVILWDHKEKNIMEMMEE